jgi:hypothetical protein
MRTVTLIILSGVFLLFLASLCLGPKQFSPYERSLDRQLAQTQHMSPATAQVVRKKVWMQKVGMAFGSFDLVNGLIEQDLEFMSLPYFRFLSFFFLFACLWVIFGLKVLRHYR